MRRLSLTLGAALLLAQPARAQQPDTGDATVRHQRDIVVTAEWLGARLGSAGVVVVHVGQTDSLYRIAHVPGARFLPLSAVATTVAGVPNEFPAPEQLAATFRDLGVGDSARIVLYGDDPGLYAARAWVALDVLGHGGRASVLDGGLTRWMAERRPVTTVVPAAAPRPFTEHWQGDRIVTAAWVRSHLGDRSVLLVDARPADQWSGGHLPGARSLFWLGALVSRDDPVLRPMHYLHEELWKPTGADQASVRTIVTYCRTGMQASHAYFVARYIGYPDVRLYDGSFSEWTSLTPPASYPVERAAP
jgi:thiosulfate/3-mercaptopyruvate sulfurtransferase